jgi:hypothetical protein
MPRLPIDLSRPRAYQSCAEQRVPKRRTEASSTRCSKITKPTWFPQCCDRCSPAQPGLPLPSGTFLYKKSRNFNLVQHGCSLHSGLRMKGALGLNMSRVAEAAKSWRGFTCGNATAFGATKTEKLAHGWGRGGMPLTRFRTLMAHLMCTARWIKARFTTGFDR